jgi:DNA-binding response OmpR family regulator
MSEYKTRVMLAEDEVDAREILEFYLNSMFDEVVIAKDGLEGYNLFQRYFEQNKRFDIIFTDIKMPNKSGLSMIEDILKIEPKQKFMIISAHTDEEDLLKSINLRALGYFVKPLDIDKMMTMLKSAKEEILANRGVDVDAVIELNDTYTYDKNKNMLYQNSKIVRLSKKEAQLLELLVQNIGSIVSIDEFKVFLWGDLAKSDVTFRAVMKRLRDKVGDDDFIVSRKGHGYIIEPFVAK